MVRLTPFEGSLDLTAAAATPGEAEEETAENTASPPASPSALQLSPEEAAKEVAAAAEARLELLLSGFVQQQTAQQLLNSLLSGPCGDSPLALAAFTEKCLTRFLETEELFAGRGNADAAAAVAAATTDTEGQFRVYVSHYALKQKTEMLLLLLKELAVSRNQSALVSAATVLSISCSNYFCLRDLALSTAAAAVEHAQNGISHSRLSCSFCVSLS